MGELFGIMNYGISRTTMQKKQYRIPVILAFYTYKLFYASNRKGTRGINGRLTQPSIAEGKN